MRANHLYLSKRPAIKKYLTRHQQIEGMNIMVFDGFIKKSIVDGCYETLRTQQYGWVNYDSTATVYNKRWANSFSQGIVPEIEGLLTKIMELTYAHCSEKDFKISQFYTNFNLYGEAQYNHRDTPVNNPGITALYYANKEWQAEWQGETIFSNSNEDALYLVSPKPGRVVLFDSRLVHRGSTPSRDCYEPRMTFAFKFFNREKSNAMLKRQEKGYKGAEI